VVQLRDQRYHGVSDSGFGDHSLLGGRGARIWKVGVFNPALGGDPLLFQHIFWFYSHPAVYIMILPGMGVVSELIAAYSRKRLVAW
jgi:Cytochrome C and Quinol oxidase polypeptide I